MKKSKLKAVTIGEADVGIEGMERLKPLAEKMPSAVHDWNPIAIAELMTRSDDIGICAFAYSYGNYSRPSFTDRPLRYERLPSLDDGTPIRGILGGTGMAVTKRCQDVGSAVDYALFTGSAAVQSGLCSLAGGQPSRTEASSDPLLDRLTGGFFSAARHDQEQSLVHRRYDEYVPLQERAGNHLQRYLQGNIGSSKAWDELNVQYRASLGDGQSPVL